MPTAAAVTAPGPGAVAAPDVAPGHAPPARRRARLAPRGARNQGDGDAAPNDTMETGMAALCRQEDLVKQDCHVAFDVPRIIR